MTTNIIIDGHVHLYPFYHLEKAIENGVAELNRAYGKVHSNTATAVWLLSERSDCDLFKQMKESPGVKGYQFTKTEEEESICVTRDGATVLYIIAGRQIVSTDALEIISIANTLFLEDRSKDTEAVIDYVNNSGGVAVLNWAPGKWFFSRGKIVKRLLEKYSANELLLGDTSLRTRIWPVPGLMKKAFSNGYKLIAGSDPLPFVNEECQIGRYGFAISGDFNASRPAESVRNLLCDQETKIQLIGNRNRLLPFIIRQFKIMREK